ncbi:hypothetical protein CANCADRAFT_61337 [Tortispora caseinolytica NRRL Y-17796]|uniref:DBF4-type domain-containing protein n=1 Tax=Tortispora caseinolytica NRRL Y-17796 TaxID=767744 RepID=A0A1E4TH54_9ASCO|nr:hypothetical protein CANCADRAFT_61337 [Tortispora caseinolytica NRRL Y-17796]
MDDTQGTHGGKNGENDVNCDGNDTANRQSLKRPGEPILRPPKQPASENHAWRSKWLCILKTWHVYFDKIDDQSISSIRPILRQLGVSVDPFFSTTMINCIITSRSNVDLPARDILAKAKAAGIRIWTVSKLKKFLVAIGAVASFPESSLTPTPAVAPKDTSLSRILQEEKIHGPTDTDPNARREDFCYFNGPYIMVYDMLGKYKPSHIRHYRVSDDSDFEWPFLARTAPGSCPFYLADRNARGNASAAVKRPAGIEDTGRTETENNAHDANNNDDDNDNAHRANSAHSTTGEVVPDSQPARDEVATTAQATLLPAAKIDDEKRSNVSSRMALKGASEKAALMTLSAARLNSLQEPVASGMNSKMTSAIRSMLQSGETGSTYANAAAPSQKVALLGRKLFQRDAVTPSVPQVQVTKEAVAAREVRGGQCDNCHCNFDDFHEHMNSKSHRSFARNASNFEDIDKFIRAVQRPRRAKLDVI